MSALTFKRGVHPPDGKALTADRPIEVILPKEKSGIILSNVTAHRCSL